VRTVVGQRPVARGLQPGRPVALAQREHALGRAQPLGDAVAQ